MYRSTFLLIAAVVLWAAFSTRSSAVGTIYSGHANCEQPTLVIDGNSGPVAVPREQDAYVPVVPPIKWHCGAGNSQINACPVQTNQLHVHRQKADNPEWLYDCQVTP